jgi:hypothetical protein
MTRQLLESVRAEALFVSDIQRADRATPDDVRSAIMHAVRRHGTRGCAALVAQEFGEHPETAVGRMCWALQAVRSTFAATAAA